MDCAWQDDVRARAQARLARKPENRSLGRLRYWALGLALALHLGLLIELRDAMRVPLAPQQSDLYVVFLDSQPLPPLPKPPPIPKFVQSPSPSQRTPSVSVPVPVSPVTSSEAASPPLQLFNPNGTIWQPSRSIAAAPTPRERAEELQQRGHNILHCKPTRFTRTYRYDESVGDRFARKYLVWVGLYGAAPRERLQRRLREASEACDAQ
ncbi:MAG: hypothetical protein ABI304_14770 [Rudaea sp.]